MKKTNVAIHFMLALAGMGSLRAQPLPGTLLWSYNLPSSITTSPALASDGTIYIGSMDGLYAITNAGSNKWTFSASLKGSPAIGTNGAIYFGDYGGTFYALSPDGSEKWTLPPQGHIWSSPAIAFDNTIYFVAQGQLTAVDSAGTVKWRFPIDYTSTPSQALSPVIGYDGVVYVGSYYGHLLGAVNPDGTLKWSFAMPSAAGESPAIAADGTIYVTGGVVYALNPDGSNIWATSTSDFTGSIPAIGKDGTVYVESASGSSPGFWAFSPQGSPLWQAGPSATGPGFTPSCPAIGAGEMLYFCSSNAVFAVTQQGTIQWTFGAPVFGFPPPAILSSPAIGPDGTIYAAFQKTLYAIAGTNALANTPWPMYRQNPRHTGRAEKPMLNQPKKRADAGFQFQIYDAIGNTDTIQTSPDLVAWSTFTNIVITNVPMDFVDWTASNHNSRFYRTVQP